MHRQSQSQLRVEISSLLSFYLHPTSNRAAFSEPWEWEVENLFLAHFSLLHILISSYRADLPSKRNEKMICFTGALLIVLHPGEFDIECTAPRHYRNKLKSKVALKSSCSKHEENPEELCKSEAYGLWSLLLRISAVIFDWCINLPAVSTSLQPSYPRCCVLTVGFNSVH